MTEEITGRVLIVGKIKDYGSPSNWGRDWIENYKFFLKVLSTEHGEVLVMVKCEADMNTYGGYRIPPDSSRQKPAIGDTVRFTTHTLKPAKDDDKVWASVTWKQDFEITKVD
jgi:hypothetical protein